MHREHAKIEMSKPVLNRKDLWTFWTFNALILPNYFAVASTVALISPSSAVCERLLARILMGFGDDHEYVRDTRYCFHFIDFDKNTQILISVYSF